MNTKIALHKNKIRNMGRILTGISWTSIVVSILAVPVLIFGSFVLLIEESSEFASPPTLPPGISLDMTVSELIRADQSFLEAHIVLVNLHIIMAVAFSLLLSFILLRIARAWRRSEPFQQTAVRGFRWLGILLLGQSIFGLVYAAFSPDSLSILLIHSSLYDLMITYLCCNNVGQIVAGIVFLTLSWVLEHGRMLKTDQDLTV